MFIGLSMRRGQGFVVLEAMLALVILAVGLLALGQFQGRMMQTTAESKMVSEATHLAQRKIDQLRSLDWGHDDLAVTPPTHEDPQPAEGTNAVFQVRWDVTQHGDIRRVAVSVVLPDDGNRLVTAMHTWIAEGSDVVLAFEQQGGDIVDLDDLTDYTPPPPTAVDDFSIGDYEDPDTGKEFIVIADEDLGLALVVEGSSSGEGSGSGFARISGNVFIDDPNAFDRDAYRISLTGAGLCRVFPAGGEFENPTLTLIDQTTIMGSTYRFLGYSCYVPTEWQGFIRLRAPDDVCVGAFDLQPQAALAAYSGAVLDRIYLGADADGMLGNAGIAGSPSPGKAEVGSVCLLESDCASDVTRNLVPGGHHFLVTSLDANANESLSEQCGTKMAALDSSDYVHPNAYRSNPFWGNPGSLVCVAGSCKFSPRFGGFFTNPVDMDHETLAISGGRACQSFGPFGNTDGGTYWCALRKGVTGQIQPSSSAAAFDADPDNDSTLSSANANDDRYYYSTQSEPNTAGVEANDLSIAKVLDFTNMNFRMLAGTTGPGPDPGPDPEPTDPPNAAPNMRWAPASGDNRSLAWDAVAGAEEYEIFRCVNQGNSFNRCTPNTSGNAYGVTENLAWPPNPAGKETRCFVVRAVNDAGAGPTSARYCVHIRETGQNNTDYTWDP